MVDFQSPAVIQEDAFVVVKFWDVVNGIFVWEFLVSLDYEWSVIQRRRKYKWTIWVYSLTRICTLIAVTLNILGFDAPSSINCELWIIFELIFAYVAFAAASLLIVIRIIAIWDSNRIIVAIAMSAWLTNVAFLIHGITQLHATWVPTQSVCVVLNTGRSKNNIIVTLATDVVLVLTMLAGLLRLRHWQYGSLTGMCQLLWKQGLIWLLFATVAEVPPAVFIILNLNDPFNLMFQTPALIIMSIAATRLHRSLAGSTNSSGFSYDTSHRSGRTTANSEPRRNSTAPIPLDRLSVAGRRTSDDSARARAGQYASYTSAESLSQDKPLVLAVLDNDLGNGVKKE